MLPESGARFPSKRGQGLLIVHPKRQSSEVYQEVFYVRPELFRELVLKKLLGTNVFPVILKIVDYYLANKRKPCTENFFASNSIGPEMFVWDFFAFLNLVLYLVGSASKNRICRRCRTLRRS